MRFYPPNRATAPTVHFRLPNLEIAGKHFDGSLGDRADWDLGIGGGGGCGGDG